MSDNFLQLNYIMTDVFIKLGCTVRERNKMTLASFDMIRYGCDVGWILFHLRFVFWPSAASWWELVGVEQAIESSILYT
jgi:hypothetical protein